MRNYRRSHDIDVVDRYSDFAISLAITTDVGGLEGFIGLDDIFGDVGIPILGNAIGDVAIPNVRVGYVTVLFVEIVLPLVWHLEPIVLERLSYSLCLLMPARQSLLSR